MEDTGPARGSGEPEERTVPRAFGGRLQTPLSVKKTSWACRPGAGRINEVVESWHRRDAAAAGASPGVGGFGKSAPPGSEKQAAGVIRQATAYRLPRPRVDGCWRSDEIARTPFGAFALLAFRDVLDLAVLEEGFSSLSLRRTDNKKRCVVLEVRAFLLTAAMGTPSSRGESTVIGVFRQPEKRNQKNAPGGKEEPPGAAPQ